MKVNSSKGNIPSIILLTLMLLLGVGTAGATGTAGGAAGIVSKTASRLSGTPGVKAVFKAVSGGRSVSGTLLAAGDKFSMVVSGAPSSWYNGRDLWTYNPSTGEATVMKPSAQDLAEVNPLNYIRRGTTSFNASFTGSQPTGRYVIELLPKSSKEGVKKVTLTVSRSSYLPEKITVTATDGRTVTVSVSSIQTNMRIGLGNFEFPRRKYPGAEIVDLR